jgi:hypothetical protein
VLCPMHLWQTHLSAQSLHPWNHLYNVGTAWFLTGGGPLVSGWVLRGSRCTTCPFWIQRHPTAVFLVWILRCSVGGELRLGFNMQTWVHQSMTITITEWPQQSEAPVGAVPPTRSQLRLQRQTGTHAKLMMAATSPPRSLASHCTSGHLYGLSRGSM